jgi:hypothetical protein
MRFGTLLNESETLSNKNMNILLKNAFFLGAAVATISSSQGAVLLFGNNSGLDTFADTSAVFATAVNVNGTRAVGFSTGSTAYFLDHFSVPLRSSGSPVLNVSLWTGTTSAPTAQVGSLAFTVGGTLSGTFSVLTFTPTTSYTLTANQNYWIVLQNDAVASSTLSWGRATSSVTPTAANSSGYAYTTVFSSNADNAGGTASTPANIGNIAVYGTVVPEPHEYAMIAGLGLCAFGIYRRRTLLAKA